MPKAPSTTYAGGVISKGLYGRVDLNKYQTGLKRAVNFFINVEGGVNKRFGTYLVGKRKFQNSVAKIIRWRIANDDSYMLEFGNLYIRFIRFGGYLTIPGGHAPITGNQAANVAGFMELVTPYLASEVNEIKCTYANDVMYLFHPNHPPQVLSRLGLYDWKILDMNFSPHAAGPTGVNSTFHNTSTTADNYIAEPVPTYYKVSATMADGTETLASMTVTNADTGFRRCWVTIVWNAVAGATQYTIYKGKNGIYGFIGYTTDLTYDDRNYAPSYDVVPIGDNYNFVPPNYPRVGEFYKQRMAYAATLTETQTLWLSKSLLINSLYKSVPLQDDDAIKVPLVGRERHTINHMVEQNKFLIFTDTAEWLLGTVGDAAMSTATIDPKIQTHYGSDANLRPITIGDRILFVQNITGAIRDIGYEFTSDSFKADELSRLARDLFTGKTTVAWDYALYPYNLLPCVESDGTLNTMTYAREHEIWGWSSVETMGTFLDVACVEEITESAIYFQVKRSIDGVDTYFIERLEVDYTGRPEEMVFTDCTLTYEQALDFTAATRVNDTTLTITIPSSGYTAGKELQLEFTDGTIIRASVVSVAGSLVTATVLRVTTLPTTFSSTGQSYLCGTVITGFDHLGSSAVWVLADGKVYKKLTLVAGVLTLPYPAARVHVGLPFFASLETLDIDAQNAAGQYIQRTTDDITIRVSNSRGVYVGSSSSDRDLELIDPRGDENMYDANAVLDGPYVLPSHVEWDLTCGVKVESRDPLPLNILNIIPNVIYGN